MTSNFNRVGCFTARNIAAVLRSLTQTAGVYSEVIRQTRASDHDKFHRKVAYPVVERAVSHPNIADRRR